MRVTGAQRLAYAGVSEDRIMKFGRWTSKAFREYVREAVLGVNGGDLSKVVEGNNIAKGIQEKAQAAAGDQHEHGQVAKRAFVDSLMSNPLNACVGVDFEARWKSFADALNNEVKAAVARPLPLYCMSEGGVTHKIVDHCFTSCGWHWTKTPCRTTNDAAVTCKKCSGSSLRWGASAEHVLGRRHAVTANL